MSPRVAFVVNALTLGGTEKGLVAYALELERHGWRPEVVTLEGLGPRAGALEAAGVPVHLTSSLAEGLRGADVVHLFRGGAEEARVAPAVAASGARSFVVTDVFGLPAPSTARPADCRLLLSLSSASRFRRAAGLDGPGLHERCRVLGLPLDLAGLRAAAPAREEAKERLGLDPARPVVGRIGRADDMKWRRLLCDMVPELLRLAPEAQVLFVGATPRVRRRLARHGVLDRCLLVEPAPDVAALHAACDVEVSAAELGETQGVAIAEALALGVPVVTCATPWVDNAQLELVEHGVTGLVAGHPRPFAEGVAGLLRDAAARARLGAAGPGAVEHLDVGPMTQRLASLYDALLQTGVPPDGWSPAPAQVDAWPAEEARRSRLGVRPLRSGERARARAERERERLRRVAGFARPSRWALAWSLARARLRTPASPQVSPARGAARMARIFVSLLSADLVTRALAAVATVLVVRSLAPAAFGEIAYALAFAAIAGVAVDLGLSILLVRDVSAEPGRGPALLGAVLKVQAALAVAVFGGGSALALTGVLGGPAAPAVLALGFAVMAANTVVRPFEATLAGYGHAHLVTVSHAVRGTALVAFTTAAVLADPTPAAALLAAFGAEAVGAATIWVLGARRGAAPALGSAVDLRGLLRRALPFALFAAFALLYARIDTIMLGALSSDAEVGTYGVAVRIVETLLAIPLFFGGAFLATVAQSGAGGERAVRALRYVLVLCVPLAFALGVTADPVVDLVAGDDYERSGEVLLRLSPVLALTAAYAVLANLQIALDRTAILVGISVGGVALKIGLSAWAIPRWGANGAAATVVAAEAAVVVAQWHAARGHVDRGVLLRWAGRLALAALAMVAVGVLAAGELSWFAGLAAGLAAFVVAARLTRCASADELRAAWRAVTARPAA